VKRVNWLRAKSRWARYEEEVELIKYEMKCTCLGMKRESIKWEERKLTSSTEAMAIYAAKQRAIWATRTEEMEEIFKKSADVSVDYDKDL
jgi:hypothetical protein